MDALPDRLQRGLGQLSASSPELPSGSPDWALEFPASAPEPRSDPGRRTARLPFRSPKCQSERFERQNHGVSRLRNAFEPDALESGPTRPRRKHSEAVWTWGQVACASTPGGIVSRLAPHIQTPAQRLDGSGSRQRREGRLCECDTFRYPKSNMRALRWVGDLTVTAIVALILRPAPCCDVLSCTACNCSVLRRSASLSPQALSPLGSNG